jgi:hypothetical protein
MRTDFRPVRTIAALCGMLALLVVLVSGCPKQENFPQPLAVDFPPVPGDFAITDPNPPSLDRDFTWSISDPSKVEGYRIYLLSTTGFGADELIGETNLTTFPATFPVSVTGLKFAVRAISTDNVEGNAAVAKSP